MPSTVVRDDVLGPAYAGTTQGDAGSISASAGDAAAPVAALTSAAQANAPSSEVRIERPTLPAESVPGEATVLAKAMGINAVETFDTFACNDVCGSDLAAKPNSVAS
jgi:guanyl-specific ribonuclease Sa